MVSGATIWFESTSVPSTSMAISRHFMDTKYYVRPVQKTKHKSINPHYPYAPLVMRSDGSTSIPLPIIRQLQMAHPLSMLSLRMLER